MKVKKKKSGVAKQYVDAVVATNIVHAAKGNVRSYILGRVAGHKKFLVEISHTQAQDHHAKIQAINLEMQDQLGKPLDDVKKWAREKKEELLKSDVCKPQSSRNTHIYIPLSSFYFPSLGKPSQIAFCSLIIDVTTKKYKTEFLLGHPICAFVGVHFSTRWSFAMSVW